MTAWRCQNSWGKWPFSRSANVQLILFLAFPHISTLPSLPSLPSLFCRMFRSAFHGGPVIFFASTCQVVDKFFASYGESPNQGHDVHKSSQRTPAATCRWSQNIPDMTTIYNHHGHSWSSPIILKYPEMIWLICIELLHLSSYRRPASYIAVAPGQITNSGNAYLDAKPWTQGERRLTIHYSLAAMCLSIFDLEVNVSLSIVQKILALCINPEILMIRINDARPSQVPKAYQNRQGEDRIEIQIIISKK